MISGELAHSHQGLWLLRVEWQIQDEFQAEAASFVVVETKGTKKKEQDEDIVSIPFVDK